MNKTVVIEGMMCEKCKAHALQALESINAGKSITVDLQEGKAYIEDACVTDESITHAITTAGYSVVEIING